jgi:hypothetical protein
LGRKQPAIEVWQSYAIAGVDRPHELVVVHALNEDLTVGLVGNALGQLMLSLEITDRSAEPPDYEHATIVVRLTEAQQFPFEAVLRRVRDDRLAIVAADTARLSPMLRALAAERTSFEVVATCALWTGQRTIVVAASGLAPLAQSLLSAHLQASEMLSRLGPTTR